MLERPPRTRRWYWHIPWAVVLPFVIACGIWWQTREDSASVHKLTYVGSFDGGVVTLDFGDVRNPGALEGRQISAQGWIFLEHDATAGGFLLTGTVSPGETSFLLEGRGAPLNVRARFLSDTTLALEFPWGPAGSASPNDGTRMPAGEILLQRGDDSIAYTAVTAFDPKTSN